jgi:hypothetical protein
MDITENRFQKLILLTTPLSVKKISERLNISTRGVYKAKFELIKKGYLTEDRTPTSLGTKALEMASIGYDIGSPSSQLDNKNILNIISKLIRLKRIRFFCEVKFRLLENRGLPKYTGSKVRVYKTWQLKGGVELTETTIDDIRVRITSRHVIMIPPELYGDDPMQVKNKAWLLCESIIPKVEAWFNVKVADKPNKVYMTFSKQHFAFMDNAIAKYVKDPSRKWNITIYDQQDGKARIVVDMSKGFPELETIHPIHAEEDAERIKTMLEDYTLRSIETPGEQRSLILDLLQRLETLEEQKVNIPKLPNWIKKDLNE